MTTVKKDLRHVRDEYSKENFTEREADNSPFKQFNKWLEQSIECKVNEINAMTLATAGADGQPDIRIVLLKEYDERGFVFYTNYNSSKGRQLAENSKAALAFFWPQLERQVKILGRVEKVSPQESEEYFHSRPRGSQLGALASPQSTHIEGRHVLEKNLTNLEKQYENDEVPYPEYWGGFRVIPQQFEFWQGRPNRLHDRIAYYWENGEWVIKRLAP